MPATFLVNEYIAFSTLRKAFNNGRSQGDLLETAELKKLTDL